MRAGVRFWLPASGGRIAPLPWTSKQTRRARRTTTSTISCPRCQSLEWDTIVSQGRGHVYSFVIAHHPPVPPFAYPNAIALIELDEGTRIVSNVVGIDPGDVAIGQRVRVEFTRVDGDLVLPLFRPDPS